MRRAIVVAAAAFLVSACTSGGSDPATGPTASTQSASTSATDTSPAATPTPARAVPPPRNRACYDYAYRSAVAPVVHGAPTSCDRPHTAITFQVGDLDTIVGGHLVSVDSQRVQDQVARECPAAFDDFVGGTSEARRLTMLRPVWFTPSLQESDKGANWYRCDAIALAADEELAPLVGRLRGVLSRPLAAARYAVCGTAEPGTPEFRRVICAADHTWRALSTVDIDGTTFPGLEKVRAAGRQPCQDAASAVAEDPLNYRWGYQWPTADQWADGQHYGVCWAPA